MLIDRADVDFHQVDGDYVENVDCYFHHDTPVEVRTEYLVNLRVSLRSYLTWVIGE